MFLYSKLPTKHQNVSFFSQVNTTDLFIQNVIKDFKKEASLSIWTMSKGRKLGLKQEQAYPQMSGERIDTVTWEKVSSKIKLSANCFAISAGTFLPVKDI